MKNLVKELEENCRECSTEEIVNYLFRSGDLSFKSEQHREIYNFFVRTCEMLGEKLHYARQANTITIEHFKISYETLKHIKRRFQNG